MGNICRSPAAECVFRDKVEEAGLQDRIQMDSAGTIGFHSGHAPDARMRETARQRGIQISGKARQVTSEDLERFDLIVGMDDENLEDLRDLARRSGSQAEIRGFCEWVREHDDQQVPDPYYGGQAGFEHVMDLMDDGCGSLLEDIQQRLAGRT